ncbi:MAG: cytochrome b/b6 domain-containing protein [Ginsengibacter sp.]
MKKVIKKHPLAIRWLHWINFPILAVMIWSGLLIYWANDAYRVGWGNTTIIKFFPDSFFKALHVPFRLAEGMSIHFVFMWLFAINGFLYVLYLFISGEWRLIFPNKKSLKESWLVVLHDLHIKKGIPPQKKYNAAQRIAYTGVIIIGLGSLLTGLAIYKPVQFHLLVACLGGYEWARAEHFILTILFTLFFVVHIVQVILAGWNNFRSMVTGLDVLPADKVQLATTGAVIDSKELDVPVTEPSTTKVIKEKVVNHKPENLVEKSQNDTDDSADEVADNEENNVPVVEKKTGNENDTNEL